MRNLVINTDGGARGNPGPAALGYVIKDLESGEIIKKGRYLGNTTNNIAEYSALVDALEQAAQKTPAQITCYLDSELVVKQLNGTYKVKDQKLAKLYMVIKAKEKLFEKIAYVHVPRAQNKEADKIVNEVLDLEHNNA